MCALIFGAQSSVLPFAAPYPYFFGAVHAPAAVAVAHPGPYQVVSGPAVVKTPAVVATVAAAPAVVKAPVVALPVVPPVVAAPGGTFVAKTRGSLHVAPLEGHVKSVASVNLEPAPGTW